MDHQRSFAPPYGARQESQPFRSFNDNQVPYQRREHNQLPNRNETQPNTGHDQTFGRQSRRPAPYNHPNGHPQEMGRIENQGADHQYAPVHQKRDCKRILIDSYGSDLYLDVDSSGLVGCPQHKDGFQYMWAGCRATYGAHRGKVCFECHVLEALKVDMPETETTPNVLRVGWSTESSSIQLGEDQWSYGYGGTGKASTNNKFDNYGQRFSEGDVITCYADLESNPKALFYSINGVYQGVAFNLEPSVQGRTLFPHVSVKNMKFRLNFGGSRETYPLNPGFTMLEHCNENSLQRCIYGPVERKDAEVLMMVGLPASGKTFWCTNYEKNHPDKKYCILGTNDILDRMRMMKLARKRNYHGRWEALIKQASAILNLLLKIAEKKIRNYIIDQTNVYASARGRKMRAFRGYRRIAVVVVNDNMTLHQHTEKREKEEGKLVPATAVMEMKQNFSLPQTGESFDDVWYVDYNKEASCQIVSQFNEEGRQYLKSSRRNETSFAGPGKNSNNAPIHLSSRQDSYATHKKPFNSGQPMVYDNQHPSQFDNQRREQYEVKSYQRGQMLNHQPQMPIHEPVSRPPFRYPNQDISLFHQTSSVYEGRPHPHERQLHQPRMPYADHLPPQPQFGIRQFTPPRPLTFRGSNPYSEEIFRPHGRY